MENVLNTEVKVRKSIPKVMRKCSFEPSNVKVTLRMSKIGMGVFIYIYISIYIYIYYIYIYIYLYYYYYYSY